MFFLFYNKPSQAKMIYSSLFLLFCLVIGNDKLIKPSIRTLEEGVELRNIEMGSDQVHL